MVASLGAAMGCLCRVISPPTVYALGYDEVRFRKIQVGMTTDQVEAFMGPPLAKSPWDGGQTLWKYSDQYTYTSDFDRRWVYFLGNRVQEVYNDRWYD